MVLAEAALVGEASLFLLEVGGVGQQHAEQARGRRRAEDRALETLSDQAGKPARVIDVGVGQDDRVHLVSRSREGFPVEAPEFGRALEEADARKAKEAADAAALPEDERGGPRKIEPTRYGDWERKGIAYDF
mgnify:CR=1 FL=1